MQIEYSEFIKNKNYVLDNTGFMIDKEDINPMMFDFEKDITRWALAKGKAAVFSDCGLGKTICQLEWANQICKRTNGRVLILAPLAVAPQTKREASKFGIQTPVKIVETGDDVITGINITNYEKLDHFQDIEFDGVVLDESSILKSFTGKERNKIIGTFINTKYKLACTATPSPNDYMELGNHSEFLGVMTRSEMLATFFVHDGGQTSKWRLKGHCETMFWEWMSSWAVVLDNPKTLGYDDEGYNLPSINIKEIIVDADEPVIEKLSLTERRNARKESLNLRCQAAADLANNSDEQWLVWCDLNAESDLLHKLIPDSKEVKGSDKPSYKTETMVEFSDSDLRCLVTKPLIAGYGMNWQSCHNMIFVGLSDSYEQYYQAVRRCYRFGQEHEVNVYIIISAKEGCVKENIEQKEAYALRMQKEMIKFTKDIMRREIRSTCRMTTTYNPGVTMILPEWKEFAA